MLPASDSAPGAGALPRDRGALRASRAGQLSAPQPPPCHVPFVHGGHWLRAALGEAPGPGLGVSRTPCCAGGGVRPQQRHPRRKSPPRGGELGWGFPGNRPAIPAGRSPVRWLPEVCGQVRGACGRGFGGTPGDSEFLLRPPAESSTPASCTGQVPGGTSSREENPARNTAGALSHQHLGLNENADI